MAALFKNLELSSPTSGSTTAGGKLNPKAASLSFA